MVVNHIKIFQRMKKQRLVIVCARLRQVTPFPSTFVPSNFHLMLYNVSYGQIIDFFHELPLVLIYRNNSATPVTEPVTLIPIFFQEMSYLFSIKFSSKEILKRKSLHLPHNMCFFPYIILIQGILYQQHSIRKLLKTSLPSILNTLYCPNILVFPSNTLLYATPKFRQRTYFSKDMKAYSTSDPII